MNALWNVPLSEERALTCRQFCLAEDLTEDEFDDLAENGMLPCPTYVVTHHSRLVRIMPEARREWHRQLATGFNDLVYREKALEALKLCCLMDGEHELPSDDGYERTVVSLKQGKAA